MSARVLTTEQAENAITKMKSIIDGGLVQEISNLEREGNVLSDPNNWDGQLAVRFRGDWEQTRGTLKQVHEQLSQLQSQIKAINADIKGSGGGYG